MSVLPFPSKLDPDLFFVIVGFISQKISVFLFSFIDNYCGLCVVIG